MPEDFCVPGAGAKCSSARAAIGASSTAEPVAVVVTGGNVDPDKLPWMQG